MTKPSKTKISPKSRRGDLVLGGEVIELDFADINVDDLHYQRGQQLAHINTIKVEFNEDLFTPIVVARRAADGSYWLIDGLQRFTAARQLGYTRAKARVVDVRSHKTEAWLFTKLNMTPKSLSSQDLYKSSLAAGDRLSTSMEKVLRQNGMTALPEGSGTTINAVAKMREAYGPTARIGGTVQNATLAHGEKTLDWALKAGALLMEKGEKANKVYSGANLGALIWIHRSSINTLDLPRVQQLLSQTTAEYLQDHVIKKITGSSGGSRRGLWGTRLAYWMNVHADRPVVTLPASAWLHMAEEDGIDLSSNDALQAAQGLAELEVDTVAQT